MTSILEGSLARAIYKGMRGLFLDATLVRDVPGTNVPPTTTDFDPATPTQVEYPCKAVHETYTGRYANDTAGLQRADRKVIILAQSLDVTPAPGDTITIRNRSFSVIQVEADPALAAWTCLALSV